MRYSAFYARYRASNYFYMFWIPHEIGNASFIRNKSIFIDSTALLTDGFIQNKK